VQISDLAYSLTPENIVGTPRERRLGRRDLGRLLLVNRATETFEDRAVLQLPDILKPGDVVVLNNSKRIPGVLHGRTPKGGKVELRFVDLGDDGTGLCRIFPMHDVETGTVIHLRGGGQVRVLEMNLTKYGLACVTANSGNLRALLREQGTPILGFFYDGMWSTRELNPYFATEEGSVESPLAGLHFTEDLVLALEKRGIEVAFVTLHSVGSWLPFLEEKAEDHEMWAEAFCVSTETAAIVNQVKARGDRVIACGSTSLRALESAVGFDGHVNATSGRTKLYVHPGYKFQVVDGFFTNFHQQMTSLIVLDCTFAGQALVKRAYRRAAESRYEFFEFGDAVLYL
jgi:S-adenosylmethionine:tRNA ribosyltransferase-isomerase